MSNSHQPARLRRDGRMAYYRGGDPADHNPYGAKGVLRHQWGSDSFAQHWAEGWQEAKDADLASNLPESIGDTMTTDRAVSDEALLPCPFCGGPAKMISTMGEWSKGGYGPDGSRVVCADLVCPTHSRVFHGDNQEAQAIAAWNRRAASPFLAGDGVKVRPLVWSQSMVFGYMKRRGFSPFGEFVSFDVTGLTPDQVAEKDAAAQTDYEARIRSALSAPPPQPEVAGLVVTEAMRNAFYEATDITREGTILNFDDGLRAALASMDRRG